MNSEERHRLKANEFGQLLEKTGNSLERYATPIVATVCVLLLIAAAVTWWFRSTTAASTAAWTLLESAENVGDYGTIADKFKNTPAGNWALLRAAELNLKTGIDAMFTDRELSLTDLKRAREGFDQLLASTGAGPIIRERAAWGMARCLESTSDGDTTKAIEAYQRLVSEFPETIYKPFAEERIAALKTGGAKEFYAWFSKQNPKPADIRPKDGPAKDTVDPFLPPAAAKPDANEEKSTTDGTESSPPKNGDESSATKPSTDDTAAETPAKSKPETKPVDAPPEKPDSDPPKSDPPKDEAKSDKSSTESP